MRFWSAASAALLLLLLTPATAGEQSYEIYKKKRFYPGLKIHAKANGRRRFTLVSTDQRKQGYLEYRAEYTSQLIELVQDGIPLEYSITFKQFDYRVTDGEAYKSAPFVGKTIRLYVYKEFKIAGVALAKNNPITKSLRMMFPVADPAHPREDVVFNPEKPVKVGETWEPKKQKIIDQLQKTFGVLRVNETDMECKLAEITNRGGREYAKIKIEMRLNKLRGLPMLGQHVRGSGSYVARGAEYLPYSHDGAYYRASYSRFLTFDGKGEGKRRELRMSENKHFTLLKQY